MEKSIKNHLCKYIRGTGLTKTESHNLLNQVEIWHDSCGLEWTVDRLKAYHHWYITLLAGQPEIPAWTAHTKSGYPKGPMKVVFQQKNPQRALALLSMHTAFVHLAISKAQAEKLEKVVNAPPVGTQWTEIPYHRVRGIAETKHLRLRPSKVPGFDCLTGTTIPVGRSKPRRLLPGITTRNEVVQTYAASWISVPEETLRFLGYLDNEDLYPTGLQGQVDMAWSDIIQYDRRLGRGANPNSQKPVGRIACIQEPSLKARWIANPNRIAQHFMRPLQEAWADMLHRIPSDCTFNQGEGVSWTKRKLSQGVELSSTDLSSATDLIDMWGALDCVHATFQGLRLDWQTECNYRLLSQRKTAALRKGDRSMEVLADYMAHVTYFTEMSRGLWLTPINPGMRWRRGQPLGTAPSFALLGLTNNACAINAALESGLDPWDSFRVIGDDIIMVSTMESAYREYITRLGAEINDTKSVRSSQVVEFAGLVISRSQDFLKRVKFKEVSDNNFVKLVGMLGDQAVSLLRPRQRKQWDNFKYVPGVAVEGPYNPNSLNEPFATRYDWYLRASGLLHERPEPEVEKLTGSQFANTMYFSLLESASTYPLGTQHFNSVVPSRFSEDFQSSLATELKKRGGDPRLKHGKTMLQVFEEISTSGRFQKFLEWKQSQEAISIGKENQPSSRVASVPEQPTRLTRGWER
jgi:hypothetical protein